MDRRSFIGRLIAGGFGLAAGSQVSIAEAKASDLNDIDALLIPLEEGIMVRNINSVHLKYSQPSLVVSFQGDIRKLNQLEHSLLEYGKHQWISWNRVEG